MAECAVTYSWNPRNAGVGSLFAGELDAHKVIIRALGIGCAPVLIKSDKKQFLDWLSWGVESGAVKLPVEPGSVRWPSLSLQDIFVPAS